MRVDDVASNICQALACGDGEGGDGSDGPDDDDDDDYLGEA